MQFISGYSETMVLAQDHDLIVKRLMRAISEGEIGGEVTNNKFTVTAKLIRPPQFQPRAEGTIESTSRGTVLFIRYQLQPATRVLLVVWSVIMIVIGLAGVILEHRYSWLITTIAMILLPRFIAIENIRIHKDTVKKAIVKAISSE